MSIFFAALVDELQKVAVVAESAKPTIGQRVDKEIAAARTWDTGAKQFGSAFKKTIAGKEREEMLNKLKADQLKGSELWGARAGQAGRYAIPAAGVVAAGGLVKKMLDD